MNRKQPVKSSAHQSIYDAKNPYILKNGYKIRIVWEGKHPKQLTVNDLQGNSYVSPLPAHSVRDAFMFLLRYDWLIPHMCIDPKTWGRYELPFAYDIMPILVTPNAAYKRLQIVTSSGRQRILIASPSYLPAIKLLFMVYPAMVHSLIT